MLAVFKTGGKQYSVKAGQILKVEKLDGNKGDSISFNNVLAISEVSKHTIGNPLIEGAIVQAKIIDQIRDKKIIVFKKRQRQNYRHTQGHRQYLTILKIETIALGKNKSTAPSKKIEKKSIDTKKNILKDDSAKKTLTAKKSPKKKTTIKKKSIKQTSKDK